MIGANDKKLENGLEQLRSNLEALCAKVTGDGNSLVLMTPNPATAANDAKPNRFYTQAQVAEVIRQTAGQWESQVLFIDHFAAMMEDCRSRGLSLEDYLEVGAGPENDGLHPGESRSTASTLRPSARPSASEHTAYIDRRAGLSPPVPRTSGAAALLRRAASDPET